MAYGKQNRLRARCNNIVFLYAPSGLTIMTKAHDLSLNGIFIETHQDLPVGSECKLDLITDSDKKITIMGRVTRSDSNGVALTFLQMSHEVFFELKELVRHHVADVEAFDEQCHERFGFK